MSEINKKKQIYDLVSSLSKIAKKEDVKYVIMSDVATSYIDKVSHIYDCTSKLAKEKADHFSELTKFRNYIAENIEIIKKFKSISRDICQIIERRNFDIGKVATKFDFAKTRLRNESCNSLPKFEKVSKPSFSNLK